MQRFKMWRGNPDEHMEEVEEEPLEKGEEEWRPGMRLSASHPSWMWKQNRKDLASRDGRNKAGKKIGKGTTSLNRAGRSHLSTPRQNPWKREQKLLPAHHPWKREHLSTPRQNPWKREQKLLPAHHPWKREHLPPAQLHP